MLAKLFSFRAWRRLLTPKRGDFEEKSVVRKDNGRRKREILAYLANRDALSQQTGYRAGFEGYQPKNAQLVLGIWLPDTEEHLIEWMTKSKWAEIRDGRGTYQIHKLDAAMKYIKQRRVCVDIGAHVGLWSMQLVKLFEHVVAFEPVPHHAELFQWNVQEPNVDLYRFALGESEGHVKIQTGPGSSGFSRITGDGNIPMRTLDSFGLSQVDFVKIDTEGYELPILKGGERTILSYKPIIIVEQKGQEFEFYGERQCSAVHWLKERGARELEVISGDYIMGW